MTSIKVFAGTTPDCLHFTWPFLNKIKVDVDRNPEAAEHFQIQGVPTLILFKNGQVKWRKSGVVPANTLVEVIHQYAS